MRLYCSCTQPCNFGLAGIYEAGSHPPSTDSAGRPRRVVFSSTGDLVPESGAAPNRGLHAKLWIQAAWPPLRFVIDSLAVVLIPSDCRICDRPLDKLTRIPVCDACLHAVTAATVTACSVCGEALEFEPNDLFALCPLCRRVPPRFDFAITYGGYDGTLRSLVHLLKYDRLRPAADVLGQKLAKAISAKPFDGDLPVLVVPVPLHRAKSRQRGFNQSELIARAALKQLLTSRFELHCGNLCRMRATESQTGLTRHQRRENVRGAFKVSRPEQMRGRTVLIVDDVYTTGTTLNECAHVIRAAGAKQVAVATVARVYRPVAELVVSSASKQEEHASAFAGAVAG